MAFEELVRRLAEKTEALRRLLPAEQEEVSDVDDQVRDLAAKYRGRRLAEGETRTTEELMEELAKKYR